MQKIFLIEDDAGIAHPLSLTIENAGYDICTCDHGNDAIDIYKKENPDLIILDINLPGKNGFELCRDFRTLGTTPIIVLSARNSEADKLALFNDGADDYVAKPFSSAELLARISAIIKRAKPVKKPKNVQLLNKIGTIFIDHDNFQVLVDNEEVSFTKTEFEILDYLVQNQKKTITRKALMSDVMGYDDYVYDRTIDTHIKNLRKKLENHLIINTIRGIGYTIELPNNS